MRWWEKGFVVFIFTMKICSKCKCEKNLDEFYPNSSGKFGVKSVCKICEKENKKKYTSLNKEKIRNKNIAYYIKNKNINKNKKWADVSEKTKIGNRLRCRLRNALKGKIKSQPTWKLIGCDMNELKAYLIDKFTEGMTWNDVMTGKIHIDHILPCCNFDLSNKDEQAICFNYKNLQPLWAKDNYVKNKY